MNNITKPQPTIADLKVRGFDLVTAKQRIEQELQQIHLAIFQMEKEAQKVGPVATEVPGGADSDAN